MHANSQRAVHNRDEDENMNRFLTTLETQKLALIAQEPRLATYFVDIKVEALGGTVPFLPIACFRDFDVYACASPKLKCFRSSGSTSSVRARHCFSKEGLDNYSLLAFASFLECLARFAVPSGSPVLSLVPTDAEWSESSLAAMIAMFATNGQRVEYTTPARLGADVARLCASNDRVIVFGTTSHHWSCYVDKVSVAKVSDQLVVFDTGGTKGRTRYLSHADSRRMLTAVYGEDALFLSEYGMCELASQAYSAASPHDSRFVCGAKLLPIAVDLRERTEVKNGKEGFLAFIDSANIDSYGAILTEDLGSVGPHLTHEFRLSGRAPDASLKGCSLNVKDEAYFRADPCEAHHLKLVPSPARARPWDAAEILSTLKQKSCWNAHALLDLERSLAHTSVARSSGELAAKRILCVASANIPITWLYPALTAFELGAARFAIDLPSMRYEDPAALVVRKQCETLIAACRDALAPMEVEVLDGKRSVEFFNFDICLVFGSDETIKTFQANVPPTLKLVGLGDVWNALDSDDAKFACDAASAWNGRGCLSPRLIFVSEGNSTFVGDFSARLEDEFLRRYKELKVSGALYHAHHKLLLAAALERLGLSTKLFQGEATAVVDFTDISNEALSEALKHIDLDFAGHGLVYVMKRGSENLIKRRFTTFDPFPKLNTPHCGKLWREWFGIS